jgi:biopolymer transport protein TolQ
LEGLLPTPGFFLALQEVGGSAPTHSAAAGDFTDLILAASPIVQFVMALLVLFSVISWGIVLYKWWGFRGIEKHTATFLEVFRKSAKFSEVQAVCPSLSLSPLVGMFQAGYAELTAQLRSAPPAVASPGTPAPRPTLKSITAVDRALLRASSIEVAKLEKRVTFLATQGSTDLAVVSGPIAEALIATALGLFAAIPAVYFYNHFTTKVKGYAAEMDDFALEFLNISERNFT